jgi:peptidoglycan hydrolase-like protein with peptidoglycan-binding domain
MRKGFNTLNEEINRMKSLFTEERMFGNLVEQEKVLTEGNVLKMGSKGKEVEALQNLLSITPVDGDFGKITKSKVEEFQKNNGLSVDGVVGEKTLNVIVKKFAEAGNITNNQNESIIREQSLKFDKNNLNNLKILTKGRYYSRHQTT